MNDDEFFEGLEKYLAGEPKWLHPDLPGRVVREIPVYEYGVDPLLEAEQLRLLVEELPTFGIQSVQVCDARSKSKQAFMVVVDYIPGSNYSTERPTEMTPAIAEKAHTLHDNLFAYITHKVEQGEPMLTDIETLSQYIYSEESEQFVLIDIGTSFVNLRERSFRSLSWELLSIGHLLGDVARLQAKYPKGLANWRQRATDACALIFAKNGVAVPHEKLKRLVRMMFSKDDFELDDLEEVALEIYRAHNGVNGS